MITLQNDKMTVKISEIGAELKSISCSGIEYIWEGKKEIWGSSAPMMFPICGGLKDNKYIFEGKEYTLPKHGYCRSLPFDIESADEHSAVFLHTSSEETKKSFPFEYELRVIFTLKKTSLNIEYKVNNLSEKTMYFSIGSHEGYYTPEGIEDYDVIFPQNETLNASVLYGALVSNQSLPILKDSNVLPLYDKYFTIDALVFRGLKSHSATLRNRKTGKAVKIDFPYATHFLLWHKPNAPFICIEPWAGVQDTVDSNYDITVKEGIISLGADEVYNATHTISIIE